MTHHLHYFPAESRDAAHPRLCGDLWTIVVTNPCLLNFSCEIIFFPVSVMNKIIIILIFFIHVIEALEMCFFFSVRRILLYALASLRFRAMSLWRPSPTGINRSYSWTPLNYLGESGCFKLKSQNSVKGTTKFACGTRNILMYFSELIFLTLLWLTAL